MDRGIIKLRALYIIILPTVNVSLSVITVCIHPGNHTLTFVQTEQHQVHKLGLMPARSTGAQWGAHSLSPSRLLRSLWWRPPPTVFITKAHTSGRQSDLCSRRQTLTIHMYVFHSTQLEPELCPFLRLWNTPVPNTGLYSPVMWAPLTHSIWPQTLRQILHWFIALTIWATDLQHKSGPGCAAEGQHTCTAYVFLPYWLCWGTLVSTNKRQWILHSAACKQQEEECNRHGTCWHTREMPSIKCTLPKADGGGASGGHCWLCQHQVGRVWLRSFCCWQHLRTGSSDAKAWTIQTSPSVGEIIADEEWAWSVFVRHHRSPSRSSSLLKTIRTRNRSSGAQRHQEAKKRARGTGREVTASFLPTVCWRK